MLARNPYPPFNTKTNVTHSLPRSVSVLLMLAMAVPCWTGCRQQNSVDPGASGDLTTNDAAMSPDADSSKTSQGSDSSKKSLGSGSSETSLGSGSSETSKPSSAAEPESAMELVAPTQTKPKPAEPVKELLIGSVAPPLDIEHWFSTGGFDRVTGFEPGKLYVVEFWATWCGPCLASMPHLVELQETYRDIDLQIISVSDEDPDKVEAFLEREVPGDSDQTFGELTSNYSLTADPDRSVYTDYMKAASQSGIPCAFIVGKAGEIEWIGHPMGMDEPLEQIIADDWDREAFKVQRQKEQELMKVRIQVQRLLQQDKTDEALSLIDSEISTLDREGLPVFLNLRYVVLLSVESPDAVEALQELTETLDQENEAQMLNSAAWGVVALKQRGGRFTDGLVSASWDAIEKANQLLPDDPSILDTQAHLAQLKGDLDLAIQLQTRAVELAPERSLESMQRFLDELKAAKAEEDSDDEEASDEEASDEEASDEEASVEEADDATGEEASEEAAEEAGDEENDQ